MAKTNTLLWLLGGGAALFGLSRFVANRRNSANSLTVDVVGIKFLKPTVSSVTAEIKLSISNTGPAPLTATNCNGTIFSIDGKEVGKFFVPMQRNLTLAARSSTLVTVVANINTIRAFEVIVGGATVNIEGIVTAGGVDIPFKETIGLNA